jgi:hypothetical protein|tara:strand:+ start:668 stop:877 length:210 start_codon:yes stop_codon:yes gene_type:complete
MKKKKTKKKDPKENSLKVLSTRLLVMQEEYATICRELLENPSVNDQRQFKLRESMLEIETKINEIKNNK